MGHIFYRPWDCRFSSSYSHTHHTHGAGHSCGMRLHGGTEGNSFQSREPTKNPEKCVGVNYLGSLLRGGHGHSLDIFGNAGCWMMLGYVWIGLRLSHQASVLWVYSSATCHFLRSEKWTWRVTCAHLYDHIAELMLSPDSCNLLVRMLVETIPMVSLQGTLW